MTIHGKETLGHGAIPSVNQWFSQYLGVPVQALYQREDDIRLCDPAFAAVPGQDVTGFSDGFPYLVTSETMLSSLNDNLPVPVPMNRFRPNIVIGGAHPDEDYTLHHIEVGEVGFSLVKPCTRCIITKIDQELGVKSDVEPLSVLAKTMFLAQDFGSARVQGAIFGENAVPTSLGRIRRGDLVSIKAVKPRYKFGRKATAKNLG